MKNSLKQLLRTPGKTLLFFLLILSSTLLLVFGTVMLTDTEQQILAAKKQFHTVGTVEQVADWEGRDRDTGVPVRQYDQVLSAEDLLFEGANYVNPPQSLTYMMAYTPDITNPAEIFFRSESFVFPEERILEVTPVPAAAWDNPFGAPGIKEITVQIKEVAPAEDGASKNTQKLPSQQAYPGTLGVPADAFGEDITLEVGKTYIIDCYVYDEFSGTYTIITEDGSYLEYAHPTYTLASTPLFSTQYDASGSSPDLSPENVRTGRTQPVVNSSLEGSDRLWNLPAAAIEEVTEGFYETDRGKAWLNMAEELANFDGHWLVTPTAGLHLLPSFREGKQKIIQGREITEEEFASGARVCMIPQIFAQRNLLHVGDTVPLSLLYSLVNYQLGTEELNTNDPPASYRKGYTPLDENLESYEPFWEAEYEIVGTFGPLTNNSIVREPGRYELPASTFIIPSASIEGDDTGHIAYYGAMNKLTTSFEIENGTIEEFDAKLRENVPQISRLKITYSDGGYSEVMASLNSSRLTALLLFAAGLFSSLAIVVLLLYFFIVKQKKRTAIERSMGMTARQCRRSLISGLLCLTALAAALGSGLGAYLLTSGVLERQAENLTEFDVMYSFWAISAPPQVILDPSAQLLSTLLYATVPLALLLVVALLARFLVNRNLKIEPILLLGGKEQE